MGAESSGSRACRPSLFRLPHPLWDVALTVQHAPDIDVIGALNVEDKVRISLDRPEAQAAQVQFVGVPRRTGGRMAADTSVGAFQAGDEAERRPRGSFTQVVRDYVLGVSSGTIARNNRL